MITESSWFIRPKSNTHARLRLFCFPYAGGSASIFHTWANALPKDVEVCPVQLPGRANRLKEAPYDRIEPLIETLVQALQPELDLPCVLFGHSLGALISFELGRALSAIGCAPLHLFVSARHAPHLPDPIPSIHDFPEEAFIDGIKHFNGTPGEILRHQELLELFLPMLRADFSINGTYRYSAGPLLTCPITAFGGLQDAIIDRSLIEPWREQTSAAFTLRMFPGDHFFLHSCRPVLLQAISWDLNKALRQIRGGTIGDPVA